MLNVFLRWLRITAAAGSRSALTRALGSGILVAALAAVLAGGAIGVVGGDDGPLYTPGAKPLKVDEESEQALLAQDLAYTSRRTAGDFPLDSVQAGALRNAAAKAAKKLAKGGTPSDDPHTFNAAWTGLGPNPIVQVTRSGGPFTAMSGRIGALAIRPSNHQIILGAAQGGIWLYTPPTAPATLGTWSPKTDNQTSLAIGALAIAPSNDAIVYAGTGEGALSGDSMFGNGILKSSNGGLNWNHVSGDYFQGVSVSRLVVDPTNANHLYAAVLRGRGGARRTSPAEHSRFGIWESTDGAATWTLLKESTEQHGATDVEIDPQNPSILYASFWGDAIYKSTNGGATWSPIMNGLPADADYAAGSTRFSIALSHPAGQSAVLYVGFDYVDTAGHHHSSRVWKSTDQGANWSILPGGSGDDAVDDYCAAQCFYDNVIEADPTNPNEVFAAGQFNYGIGSGGVFRSDDGGQTWKNLGYEQHPDYHALAFDPSDTSHVVVGSDGGVWYSTDRGGRPNGTDPLSAVTWQNLNGTVTRSNGGVTARSNLQIAQFTSVATVPQVPVGAATERFWGGTQDNGTLRKSVNSATWFDAGGGDGGQVLVDPTSDSCALAPSCFVYGTFFGISPYRFTDGGGTFTNSFIQSGIDSHDRSDFYTPWVMNPLNANQLFFGTYRLYRTDNARASSAGDVTWNAISPDLTSGCTGTAPNGARNCSLSAIGVGGGQAVYTGSLDGYVYVSTDAQVSDNPTWTRLDPKGKVLPNRPVAQIAVDRSNYRIAYLAYDGFSAATPKNPGHVYKTTDGGASWLDISGDLPDVSVNSVILDPSFPNTLYIGTDVGPMVSYNGGAHWALWGSGFPNVGIWQIDLDPSHRLIAAGTHGRGAFRIADGSNPVPSLVLTKVDAGVPVGPSSTLNYTLTLRNIGNADATGVTITDPLPANTTFVSADNGGTYSPTTGVVTWSGLSVSKGVPGTGGSVSVHLSVSIADVLAQRAEEKRHHDAQQAEEARHKAALESIKALPKSQQEAARKQEEQTHKANQEAEEQTHHGNQERLHKKNVVAIVNDGVTATSAEGPSTTGSPAVTLIAPPYGVSLRPASQTDGARAGSSATYHVTLRNLGFNSDSYAMSSSGGTYAVTLYDSSCTTALTTTPSVAPGAATDVCVKVAVPGGASDGDSSTSTVTATSVGNPSVSASGSVKTIAVTKDWLLVDNDGSPAASRPDVQSYYTTALNTVIGAGAYSTWDLAVDKNLPQGYLTAHKYVVWFTGNSYPGPILPYEGELKALLDGGGNLFLSGQDLLDQAAGLTPFVSNYLHVTWDDASQNDKATAHVNGQAGTITAGIGAVALDHSILGNSFEDRITPNGGALAIFKDDAAFADGLSFSDTYKVVFAAFPVEAYGSASDKADLVTRVKTFFGA